MFPHERSLVAKYKDELFAIIGVNSDRDLEQLKEVRKAENITWRSFWNGPEGTSGPISAAWNVHGWPTLYVLDGAGVIRYKSVGSNEEALDASIEKLRAEMKTAAEGAK